MHVSNHFTSLTEPSPWPAMLVGWFLNPFLQKPAMVRHFGWEEKAFEVWSAKPGPCFVSAILSTSLGFQYGNHSPSGPFQAERRCFCGLNNRGISDTIERP